MRKLYLKRDNSFVAGDITDQVYVQDDQNGSVVIQNVNCRFAGTLGNGEELVIDIDDGPSTVFVADPFMTNGAYKYDFSQIPAGTEDIHLSGKNGGGVSGSNTFCFYKSLQELAALETAASENVKFNTPAAKKSNKGKIIFAVVFVILMAAVFIFAYVFSKNPRTFSKNGISITLSSSFKYANDSDVTFSVTSEKARVDAEEFKFSEFPDYKGISQIEFATLLKNNYNYVALVTERMNWSSEIYQEDGLVYFDYTLSGITNSEYKHRAYFFTTDDSVWLVEFTARESEYDSVSKSFNDWAKTITFK